LSAPFIDRIEGETSNVIGLSLPLLRKTINHLGYDWFAIANSKPLRLEVTI
jgi:septum formation protein